MSKDQHELLCTAAWEGSLADVKAILPKLSPDYVNKPNTRGQTALYCAARQQHLQIVIELLNVPGIVVDGQVEPHRGTALHAVSYSENAQIVALLLMKGASTTILNKSGLTARQEARGKVIDVYQAFESGIPAAQLQEQYPILKELKADVRAAGRGTRKIFETQRITPNRPPAKKTDPAKKEVVRKKKTQSPFGDVDLACSLVWVKEHNSLDVPVIFLEPLDGGDELKLPYRVVVSGKTISFIPDPTRSSPETNGAIGSYFGEEYTIPLELLSHVTNYDGHLIEIRSFLFHNFSLKTETVTLQLQIVLLIQKLLQENKAYALQGMLSQLLPKNFTEDPFAFSPMLELSRQGYGSFSSWNIMNFGHQDLIVLADLEKPQIESLVKFRYQSNFPTFCWGSTFTGHPCQSTLLRCERPAMYVGQQGSPFDFVSIGAESFIHQQNSDLHLMETIFRVSNPMNTTRLTKIYDTGTENEEIRCRAAFSTVEFINLSQKMIEESLQQLFEVAQQIEHIRTDYDKNQFFQLTENSSWYSTIRKVISLAFEIVKSLKAGVCVIIQGGGPDYRYSDSVIACIVEVLIDPDYRTVPGFCRLLRKDWYGEGTLSCPVANISIFGDSSNRKGTRKAPARTIHTMNIGSMKRDTIRMDRFLQNEPMKASTIQEPTPPKLDGFGFKVEMVDHYASLLLLVNCLVEIHRSCSHLFQFNEEFLTAILDNMATVKTFVTTTQTDAEYRQNWIQSVINDTDPAKEASLVFAEKRAMYRVQMNNALSAISKIFNDTPHIFRNESYDTYCPSATIDLNFTGQLTGFFNFLFRFQPNFRHLVLRYERTAEEAINTSKMEIVNHSLFWITPRLITLFSSTRVLNLQGGPLAELPHSFSLLQHLTELTLAGNRFLAIPPSLAKISTLTKLNMDENKISVIPNFLAELKSLASVSLNFNQIEEISPVCELNNLEELFLRENKIRVMPPGFSQLTNLTTLQISGNTINHISGRFLSVASRHLSGLDLSKNKITVLPAQWGHFLNLTTLNFSNNHLSSLPDTLEQCIGIKYLSLSRNDFTVWPRVISTFHLEEIDASYNKLTEIPYWMGQQKKIKALFLQFNQIDSISHALSQMQSLTELNLADNQITEIPTTLSLLSGTLRSLDIKGNPLDNKKLFDLSVDQIFQQLKDLMDAKFLLNESMVMFLGPPKVGKTTLLNKLTQAFEKEKPPENEVKDAPLSITSFAVPTTKPKTKKKLNIKAKEKRRIIVKAWDFNSQSAMKGSHHIFLRNATLIILVIKFTDHADLKYWIQTIKAHIANPQLIICFTHIDKDKTIDKTAIEAQCRDIVFKIVGPPEKTSVDYRLLSVQWYNYETSENLGVVQQFVLNYLRNDELAQQSIPFKFQQLRALLNKYAETRKKRQQTPILSLNELITYGNACGIVSMQDILYCTSLYHACGSLLYFKNKPALKDLIIVDMPWLANIISQLFTHSTTYNGLLDHERRQLFLSSYAASYRAHVFPLLQAFELATPVELTNKSGDYLMYIFALLPEQPPTIRETSHAYSSQRVIKFAFLPTTLWSIFIGRIIQSLSNETAELHVWPNGLVAKKKNEANIRVWRRSGTADETGGGRTDALTIFAGGPTLIQTRIEFVALLDIFQGVVSSTNVDCKSYFKTAIGQLFCVDDITPYLKDAQFENVSLNGVAINLMDVVPDQMVSNFAGERFSLAHFSIESTLGVGSFATVHLANLSRCGTEVALKILNEATEKAAYAEALDEFRNEISIQGKCNHPSIVSVIGIILSPFCIVTELCSHGTLYDFSRKWENPFTWKFRTKVSRDVAAGVKYLQDFVIPIAHLDLKGPNILLKSMNPSDHVCAKITDFGTSLQGNTPITVRKVDNPIWQAPEIINGEPYDYRVDTYSVGVIFWELVVRKDFFEELTFISDLALTVGAGGRPTVDPGLFPPEYAAVIEECWVHFLPSPPNKNL